MREAGLTRLALRPAWATSLGRGDPKLLERAESVAAEVVRDGVTSDAEATAWLDDVAKRLNGASWFAVECMFVVAGTVTEAGPTKTRN